MITVQFIDISASIFYDDIKAQEGFSTLINSTISHEMRNPLNAIISQQLIHHQIMTRLQDWFDKIHHLLSDHETEVINEIMEDYKEDHQIIKSSSKLLLYHVEDILGMAQIKAGKFSKRLEVFDLKTAIEEVINIQKMSA